MVASATSIASGLLRSAANAAATQMPPPPCTLSHCATGPQFLVLSSQRAGTHFLAEQLNSFGLLYHHDELLWNRSTATYDTWCEAVSQYLDEACRKASKTQRSGGVMMLTDFVAPTFGRYQPRFDVHRALESIAKANIRIILYERRNALAQVVSAVFHQGGQSPLVSTRYPSYTAKLRRERLNVSAEALLSKVRARVETNDKVRALLSTAASSSNLQWTMLFYEDLLASTEEDVRQDHSATLRQIHGFLGVPHKELVMAVERHAGAAQSAKSNATSSASSSGKLVKLHTGCVTQYLHASKAALAKAFHHSPYEWMLGDGCALTDE